MMMMMMILADDVGCQCWHLHKCR